MGPDVTVRAVNVTALKPLISIGIELRGFGRFLIGSGAGERCFGCRFWVGSVVGFRHGGQVVGIRHGGQVSGCRFRHGGQVLCSANGGTGWSVPHGDRSGFRRRRTGVGSGAADRCSGVGSWGSAPADRCPVSATADGVGSGFARRNRWWGSGLSVGGWRFRRAELGLGFRRADGCGGWWIFF